MNKKLISRRTFIKNFSLGIAGTCGVLNTGFTFINDGGSDYDPPIGDLLIDPSEIAATQTATGILEAQLEVGITSVNVNGTTANLMTYNNQFPGPTIRVNRGDLLRLNFINNLPDTNAYNILGYKRNMTNLHTHGWHVSPDEPADNVLLHLNPGDSYNYEYDTALQEAGTLSFYHPHVHGLVAEQMWAGLSGALVVEDESSLLDDCETHILVLKDISLLGSNPEPYSFSGDYICGKQGDIIMVNGQVNPRLYVRQGQVQRWRIVNASNTRFYRLFLEDHSLNLIGTDGGLLDKPYPLSEILLSPGERVDILVEASQQAGNYKLRSLSYSSAGMGMMGGMMGMCGTNFDTATLMTLTYDGIHSSVQSIPNSINPDAQRIDPGSVEISKKRSIILSMDMGMGMMGTGQAYINGKSFGSDPYTITSELGTYEEWTIYNNSGMDHPFHQHVNPAQVLSIQGGNWRYASLYNSIPAWKDTVIVPAMGRVTLLVPVLDYIGTAVFHCHILEHEDIGMMGLWKIKKLSCGISS